MQSSRPFFSHNNAHGIIIAMTGVLLCVTGNQAIAQETAQEQPNRVLSGEIGIGAEYDSNIAVIDVDTTTGAGDVSALFDVAVDADFEPTASTGLEFGYRFSQRIQSELTDFNLQSHFVSAELTQEIGAVKIGGAARYIHSRLGGAGFLTFRQVSPSISRRFGKRLFLRADYTYTDKAFEAANGRDSTVNSAGATAYFFLNGINSYLITGYRYEEEDAIAAQFDFSANNIRAQFVQRIAFGNRSIKTRIGWRYEDRDYLSVTPSIGEIRDDTRNRFQAEVEIPLSQSFFITVQHEYADFRSNLPAVDFIQNVTSARLGARF